MAAGDLDLRGRVGHGGRRGPPDAGGLVVRQGPARRARDPAGFAADLPRPGDPPLPARAARGPGPARRRAGLEPLRVHAGGVVWYGPYLHVAATASGVITCRLDDLLRVPDDVARRREPARARGRPVSSYGYRYVLPVRFAYSAMTDDGLERLRYSFLSLDRAARRPRWWSASTATAHRPDAWPASRSTPRPCSWPRARTASPGRWSRRRRRRPHPGRRDRARPLVPHRVDREVGPRLGLRRPARQVPALPLGDPDGPGGHRLVALDRPAVVGHRAPTPALDLLDEALALHRVDPDSSAV